MFIRFGLSLLVLCFECMWSVCVCLIVSFTLVDNEHFATAQNISLTSVLHHNHGQHDVGQSKCMGKWIVPLEWATESVFGEIKVKPQWTRKVRKKVSLWGYVYTRDIVTDFEIFSPARKRLIAAEAVKFFHQKGNFVSLFPGPSPVIRLAVCLPAAANQIFSS